MVKEAWDSKELATVLKRERLKHSHQREHLASHGSVLHTGVGGGMIEGSLASGLLSNWVITA